MYDVIQTIKTMKNFNGKNSLLGAGLAKSVMQQLLTQVKQHRGLTTFIEHNGVNGKFLKPDVPYNIRFSKLMKIMENKARYQTDDEFLEEWNAIGEHLLDLVRTPNHLITFL